MQRHKKYLIITIWISTIAFVGAGFVGWGQYSYGDKAGAVAKVGSIEITMGELQKSYSQLYSQYNQMFQGKFDEEQAKAFGLQRQALNTLTNQALILNLAASYDLRISDADLLANLLAQEYFFKDGVFNKSIYKESLSRNNISTKEYETDLKKQMLIQKTLKLLAVHSTENEDKIINTTISIADKIKYKLLDDQNISVNTSDTVLKPYWELNQHKFMSDVSYDVKYIKQESVSKEHDDAKISTHYTENKNHFKDSDGKILDFENAKEKVISELNAKATKDMALRAYIAYKKGKSDASVESVSLSQTNNQFNQEIFEKITQLSITSPFLKPVEMNGTYFTFKLIKVNPSKLQTFEEARASVLPLFQKDAKRKKLLEIAQDSMENFQGTTTDFITSQDAIALDDISITQASEFLAQLFNTQTKKGIVALGDGTLVLYEILEQKMLNIPNNNEDSIVQIKSAMFEEGLIKTLQSKYSTEIFLEGL